MERDQQSFRRRTRPGWTRPSENDPIPMKRLRGLDEFVKPAFVGRMDRVQRRRRTLWYALLAGVIGIGGIAGWVIG